MRVRDLGSLAVAHDGDERPVVGSRAPAMLVLLMIRANQRVPVDSLIEAAWDGRPTAGALSTLESHVWRLRQLLEPLRPAGHAPRVLVSDAGGYRLVAGPQTADSLDFAALHAGVVDLLDAGRADEALPLADRALTLWRGAPFGALGDRSWAVPAVAQLEEMHGQVLERRIEALLAVDALDRALSDLEPLLDAMPFREPLWAMQIDALDRRGRREEALQTYQRARRMLLDEVGTEPGAHLRAVHQRVLDDLPAPAGAAAARASRGARPQAPSVPTGPVAGQVHLPGRPTALLGRAGASREIGALVRDHRIVSVVGAAGVGKTRLAVEVAADQAEFFTGGVWFVDLAAVSEPDLVVDLVVSTLGISAAPAASPVEMLRHYLGARRTLLVLDNCEHVIPAVAHLARVAAAPTAAGTLLLTSRTPLDVDGEVVWTLAPLALPHPGDPEPRDAPAVALLLARLHAVVPTLALDREVLVHAVRIAEALDGLPLALELAAARARTFTLAEIEVQVSSDPGSLGRLRRSDGDHRATLRATIDWSCALQPPDVRAAHRRLAVLPGVFTLAAARAVLADLATASVEDLLARLVHCSLLGALPAARPAGPTGFRQLAPVRAHAAAASEEHGETRGACDRRDRWVGELVGRRPSLGAAAESDWYLALDDDLAAVRAALTQLLIESPQPGGARLAERLTFYWYYRSANVESARWLELARTVRTGSTADAVLVDLALASVLALRGEIDPARDLVEGNLAVLDDRLEAVSDDDRVVELGEALAGVSIACWVTEATDLVVTAHRRATEITRSRSHPQLDVLLAAVGTVSTFAQGEFAAAAERAEEVYRNAADAGNLMASWVAAGPPTIAALLSGDAAAGIRWSNRLIRDHAGLGSGAGGSFVETRANFSAMSGDFAEAARFYAAARTLTERAAMTWPRRPVTTDLVRNTRAVLGEERFDEAWSGGRRLTLQEVIAEL